MAQDLVARHVVHGLVQGVFFRASCEEEARRTGVAGWVRNRSDGTVEALFEGPAPLVEQLVRWCHDGPPRAQVETVDVTACSPAGLESFSTRG